MGIIRKAFLGTILAPAAGIGYLHATTTLIPIPRNDPIYTSPSYYKYNIHRNPATNDICYKKVPLDKLRPELLQKEGDLVLALTQGLLSGWGYEIQRRYLYRKWFGPETSSHLWTPQQLGSSDYSTGTFITDHFEVVDRTPEDVIIRCGDSPRNQPPRPSDGLLVLTAKIDKKTNTAELAITSCLFNSRDKMGGEKGPMPLWMEILHRYYARIWLVSASSKVMK